MSEDHTSKHSDAYIPSGKTELIVATTAGFDYQYKLDEGALVIPFFGSEVFTRPDGKQIVNVDRFGFHDKARQRITEILDKNPELKTVKLRYGGMTEVTVFTALELLQQGLTVQFERFLKTDESSQEGSYQGYYQIEITQAASDSRDNLDHQTKDLGTIRRHDYPEKVKEFLFDGQTKPGHSVNLGLIQRDFYPGEVGGFLFDQETGESKEHSGGGKGVFVDVKSAPEQTMQRIHDFIQAQPDTNHVNIYYSGLSEVTVIAVFELTKAGKSVSLMGFDNKTKSYQKGVFVPPLDMKTQLLS